MDVENAMNTGKAERRDQSKLKIALRTIVVVMIAEIVLELLHLAGWPAFMCMVLFGIGHGGKREIQRILYGGFIGILIGLALNRLLFAFASTYDPFILKLIFIAAFVFSLVMFHDKYPLVSNNYNFMFFLITATILSLTKQVQVIPLWLATQLIGGGILMVAMDRIKNVKTRDRQV
jgi:uncharacterized membrane protein YccC